MSPEAHRRPSSHTTFEGLGTIKKGHNRGPSDGGLNAKPHSHRRSPSDTSTGGTLRAIADRLATRSITPPRVSRASMHDMGDPADFESTLSCWTEEGSMASLGTSSVNGPNATNPTSASSSLDTLGVKSAPDVADIHSVARQRNLPPDARCIVCDQKIKATSAREACGCTKCGLLFHDDCYYVSQGWDSSSQQVLTRTLADSLSKVMGSGSGSGSQAQGRPQSSTSQHQATARPNTVQSLPSETLQSSEQRENPDGASNTLSLNNIRLDKTTAKSLPADSTAKKAKRHSGSDGHTVDNQHIGEFHTNPGYEGTDTSTLSTRSLLSASSSDPNPPSPNTLANTAKSTLQPLSRLLTKPAMVATRVRKRAVSKGEKDSTTRPLSPSQPTNPLQSQSLASLPVSAQASNKSDTLRPKSSHDALMLAELVSKSQTQRRTLTLTPLPQRPLFHTRCRRREAVALGKHGRITRSSLLFIRDRWAAELKYRSGFRQLQRVLLALLAILDKHIDLNRDCDYHPLWLTHLMTNALLSDSGNEHHPPFTLESASCDEAWDVLMAGIYDVQYYVLAMHVTLGTISPKDIAHQFVLQDTIGFNKIQVDELKGGKFTKDDKKEKAPNVVAFIAQFNEMTMFAIHSILAKRDIRQRVAAVEYFITVAQTCKELYDFNAVKAVLGALQSAPIYRLKSTWGGINKTVQKQYDEMCALMGEDNNFAALREAYSNARAHVSGDHMHTHTQADAKASPAYAPDVTTTTPMSLCVSMDTVNQEGLIFTTRPTTAEGSAQPHTPAHTHSQTNTPPRGRTLSQTYTQSPANIPSTTITRSSVRGPKSADELVNNNTSNYMDSQSQSNTHSTPITPTTPTSPMRSRSPNASRPGSPTNRSPRTLSRGRVISPTYSSAHTQQQRGRLRGSSSGDMGRRRMRSVSRSPVRVSFGFGEGDVSESSDGGSDAGASNGCTTRCSPNQKSDCRERRSLMNTLTHLSTINSVGCERGSIGSCHSNNEGLNTATPTPTMTPALTPTRPLSANMNVGAVAEGDLGIPTHIHTRTSLSPRDSTTRGTSARQVLADATGEADRRTSDNTANHHTSSGSQRSSESSVCGVTDDGVDACVEASPKSRSGTERISDTLVPRAIPFLGMFLTDLIYVDVALADNKEERDKQTADIIVRSGVGAHVLEKEACVRQSKQANSLEAGGQPEVCQTLEQGEEEDECTIYEAMHTGSASQTSSNNSTCTMDSTSTQPGSMDSVGKGIGLRPARQDFSMSMDDTLLDSNASGVNHHTYTNMNANSTYSRSGSVSVDSFGVANSEHRRSFRTQSDMSPQTQNRKSLAVDGSSVNSEGNVISSSGQEGKPSVAKPEIKDSRLHLPTTRLRSWSNGAWYKSKDPSWEAANGQPKTRAPALEKQNSGAQTGATADGLKRRRRGVNNSAHLRPILGLSSYMQGLSRFTVLMDEREAYNLSLRCEPKADRTHRPEQQWKVIDPKLFDTDSLQGSTPEMILKALNIFDERLDRLHMRLQSYKTMNNVPDNNSRDCLVPLPPGPTAVTITDDNENLWSFQLHITQLRRMYKQAIAAQKLSAPASPPNTRSTPAPHDEDIQNPLHKNSSLATDARNHDDEEKDSLAPRTCGGIDSASMPALPSTRMPNSAEKQRELFVSSASTVGTTTDSTSTADGKTRDGEAQRPSSIDINKHRHSKAAECNEDVPPSPKTRNKRGWHAFFGRSKKQGHKSSHSGTSSQQTSQLSMNISIEPEGKSIPDATPIKPATTPHKELPDDNSIRRFKSMENVFRVPKCDTTSPDSETHSNAYATHKAQAGTLGGKVSGFGVNGKKGTRLSVSSDAINNLELQTRAKTRALADTLALANAHSDLSEGSKDATQFKGKATGTTGSNMNMNALSRRATKRLLNRKKSVKHKETDKIALTATVSMQAPATVHFAARGETSTAKTLSTSTPQLNSDLCSTQSSHSEGRAYSPAAKARAVHSSHAQPDFPSGRRSVRNSIASLCPGQHEKQSAFANGAFFDNPMYTPTRRQSSDALTHSRIYTPPKPTGHGIRASVSGSHDTLASGTSGTQIRERDGDVRDNASSSEHNCAVNGHLTDNLTVESDENGPDNKFANNTNGGLVMGRRYRLDKLKDRAKSMYTPASGSEHGKACITSRSSNMQNNELETESVNGGTSRVDQENGVTEKLDPVRSRDDSYRYERREAADSNSNNDNSTRQQAHANTTTTADGNDRIHQPTDTHFISLPSTDSNVSANSPKSQAKTSRKSLPVSPASVRRNSILSVLVDPICLFEDDESDTDSSTGEDTAQRGVRGCESDQENAELCEVQTLVHTSAGDIHPPRVEGKPEMSPCSDVILEKEVMGPTASQKTNISHSEAFNTDEKMYGLRNLAYEDGEQTSNDFDEVPPEEQGASVTQDKANTRSPQEESQHVLYMNMNDESTKRMADEVSTPADSVHDIVSDTPVVDAFSFGSESCVSRKVSGTSTHTLDSMPRSQDVSRNTSRPVSISSATTINTLSSRESRKTLRASMTTNSRSSTSSSIADKLKNSPDVVGKVTRARSFFECLPTTVSPNPSILRRDKESQSKTDTVVESAAENESLVLRHRRRTDEDMRSGAGAFGCVRTRVRSYAQPPRERSRTREGPANISPSMGVEASLAQAIAERQLELLSLSEEVLHPTTGPDQTRPNQTEATAKMRALMHTQATAIETLVGLLSQGSA